MGDIHPMLARDRQMTRDQRMQGALEVPAA
jgi:hypothetical protein